MYILSDANRLPLVVAASPANVHDSEGLKPTAEGRQTRHDPTTTAISSPGDEDLKRVGNAGS
ncbi:hypothetical protein FHS35_002008 [Streptomyces umbrinus]|nr:hypothetical protein [Streptomyces umbrinus]